ncbi:MAG: multidrug effflux MFS transporter [Roseitalea sp.]|nr:multidrug effflux MFS transporter [Roseitalea sp.]MBO6722299.1 multidrug effflux MFS transporter [Roseitalea sp.]MBO6742371.1 multidrug effflux MFS transporter [Roseitalea sp.]
MLRIALVLGLLAAVGPFAIDMYLPALPAIADDLGSSVAATQTTLTAFFIAFGVSQLVYGPWADQAGRKPPLYAGLLIFIAGSVGCMVSPSVEWLTASRFLQGMGGAVVMVVPRAIIRDLHTGEAATRLMAAIMLVISVSPMLAPLAGSLLILVSGWRMIFLVLCAAAVVSLLMTRFVLDETLKPEQRVPVNVKSLLAGARTLLTDTTFMGLTFIGGFGMASFFVFIASAAFVYTGQFGLTEVGFSLAFAVNAIGFFAASQLAAPLGARIGMARMVALATAGFAATTVILFIIVLAGHVSLALLVGMLFCANAFMGLVIPSTMVMALDDHGEIAGLASSLGGTLQMVAGGVMIMLAAPFFDGTALPMVGAIALCGVIAFVIARLVLARIGTGSAPMPT